MPAPGQIKSENTQVRKVQTNRIIPAVVSFEKDKRKPIPNNRDMKKTRISFTVISENSPFTSGSIKNRSKYNTKYIPVRIRSVLEDPDFDSIFLI